MVVRGGHQPFFVLEVDVGRGMIAHVGVGNDVLTQRKKAEGCKRQIRMKVKNDLFKASTSEK